MAKNKRKKISFKVVMICVFILLFIGLAFCAKDIIKLIKNNNLKEAEVISEIKDYEYTLNENDSEYFKEKFMLLKKELEKEEVDEESYASLISELFAIDFYSLDSSINKNDVGGVQFVYDDYKEDFVKFAKDSIYKYVENNIYKDRKQELPLVLSTEVKSIEQENVTFDNDVEDSKAYKVNIILTYEKDLGYPTDISLVIIHKDKKLEIAKLD